MSVRTPTKDAPWRDGAPAARRGSGEARRGSSPLRVLACALVLGLGGALVLPGAVLGASTACPTVMPVSEVKAATAGSGDLVGSGVTVSRGTEPEPFSVHVLGVLEGAVAPGVDLIVVEADSPALQRVGGSGAGCRARRSTHATVG